MRRLILTPRWIMWHVLTLGAMVTCGFLGAWQWARAGSAMGSAINIGYGLQWPAFAVFFGVMWWRMLRAEAAQLAEAEPERETTAEVPQAPEPRGPSPFGPRPRSAVVPAADDDPELAEYNRMLAELAGTTRD